MKVKTAQVASIFVDCPSCEFTHAILYDELCTTVDWITTVRSVDAFQTCGECGGEMDCSGVIAEISVSAGQ